MCFGSRSLWHEHRLNKFEQQDVLATNTWNSHVFDTRHFFQHIEKFDNQHIDSIFYETPFDSPHPITYICESMWPCNLVAFVLGVVFCFGWVCGCISFASQLQFFLYCFRTRYSEFVWLSSFLLPYFPICMTSAFFQYKCRQTISKTIHGVCIQNYNELTNKNKLHILPTSCQGYKAQVM